MKNNIKVGDSIFLWNHWYNKRKLVEHKIEKVGRIYWTLDTRIRVKIEDLSVEDDSRCRVWLSKELYEAHQKKMALCNAIESKTGTDHLMRLDENDLREILKLIGD